MVFTNYQFYIDVFAAVCREAWRTAIRLRVVRRPGNVVTRTVRFGGAEPVGAPPERAPQMPAYHLVRRTRGITMINIGAGPSNAQNITDHVSVLRPHAWLMLGHARVRRRNSAIMCWRTAMFARITCWMRSCRSGSRSPLAEVQIALEQAVSEVTGLVGFEPKSSCALGRWLVSDNPTGNLRPCGDRASPFPITRDRA